MTQEDLNQFLAVLMYGLANNSVYYPENSCYDKKELLGIYQIARIPVFQVDGFDTLQKLFAKDMREYPILNYYFHCDRLIQSRKQYENGLNQFARNYNLKFQTDRKYNYLYFKITGNIKHQIQSKLLNAMIQNREQISYPIEELMLGIEQEISCFAKHFSLDNFLTRLNEQTKKQNILFQKRKQMKMGL